MGKLSPLKTRLVKSRSVVVVIDSLRKYSRSTHLADERERSRGKQYCWVPATITGENVGVGFPGRSLCFECYVSVFRMERVAPLV